MKQRFLGTPAWLSLCSGLFWAVAASSGAPEAVDLGEPFGSPYERGIPVAEAAAQQSPPVPVPVPAPVPAAQPAVEIPPFKALYDVKMKGVVVGELEVSLAKAEGDEWVYRQKASTKGVASLFGPEDLVETSRFLRAGDGLRVIEYRAKRKGGDADDNARFVFDHAASRVDSVGKGAPWSVDAPAGVVDPLAMTLAMRFELAEAKVGADGVLGGGDSNSSLVYNVPRQGRIKTYEFGVVGVEKVEVTGRSVPTVQVQRLRDKKDQTSIWLAPEMDYLPVRILKTRKEGGSSEVLLRSFVRS